MADSKIVVFQDKQIRRAWMNEQWYFSIADVVEFLTDSVDVKQYIKRMRQRDPLLNRNWGTICTPVAMIAADGRRRSVQAADVKGLFRIIQSIPSPKAEPFKQWLAQVGYERVQEIENPELAQERMKAVYEAKGYPKDWIDKRLRGIAIRQNLTDEWKERGIREERDFAILTAEIARATFGVTPSEHRAIKGLTKKGQNLRDHMTDLELIFTMLGERVTTEISQQEKPDTFAESKRVARRGGSRKANFHNTMDRLLELGALPVINENDTVSTEEIAVGDNDTLSAIVAATVSADLLVLLSDIDGLYDGDPRKNPDAKLIPTVETVDERIIALGGGSGSSLGTGGMATKLLAAQIAVGAGCEMVIANGEKPELLYDIVAGKPIGTRFLVKR